MTLKSHNNNSGRNHHVDQQNSVKSEIANSDGLPSEKDHGHIQNAPAEEDKFNNLMQISKVLAHDLNNLLTTILANTQLTSLLVKDEELKPYLDAVEEATGEAGEIVREFQESMSALAGAPTQRDILNHP